MPNRPKYRRNHVTDQQRSDCVGYANPVLETPYLDDLASQRSESFRGVIPLRRPACRRVPP